MVRTVKVLDSLIMLVAEQALDAVLVLEVQVPQDGVALHNFIQNVEVQGKLVDALNLLDELAANRTAHPEVMVEYLKALRAEGVPAVDEDARNSLANIELLATIVAIVEAARPVIPLYYDLRLLVVLPSLLFRLLSPSHIFERPVNGLLDFHAATTRLRLESIWSLGR